MRKNTIFNFRKVYGDVVTDDGTVIIFYLTWFNIFGINNKQAAVIIYPKNGRKKIYLTSHNYNFNEFANRDSFNLVFNFPGGSFGIRYKNTDSDELAHFSLENCLTYQCLVLQSNCSAFLETSSRLQEFYGSGYLDLVSLGKVTRFIGLKSLQWGRIHFPDRAILFMTLQLKHRDPFGVICLSDSQTLQESNNYNLSRNTDSSQLSLTSDITTGLIGLHPYRCLHRGPAISDDLFPSKMNKIFFSLFTGPATENRWLSNCSMGNNLVPRSWAVHEEVHFDEQELRDIYANPKKMTDESSIQI